MKIFIRVLIIVVAIIWLAVAQAKRTETPIVSQDKEVNSVEKVNIQTIKGKFSAIVESAKKIKNVKKSKVLSKPTIGDNTDWDSELAKYDWDVKTAKRILICESGGNSNAKNKSSSASGLMQIIKGTWEGNTSLDWETYRFDGVENIKVAYHIWKNRGFAPWQCK